MFSWLKIFSNCLFSQRPVDGYLIQPRMSDTVAPKLPRKAVVVRRTVTKHVHKRVYPQNIPRQRPTKTEHPPFYETPRPRNMPPSKYSIGSSVNLDVRNCKYRASVIRDLDLVSHLLLAQSEVPTDPENALISFNQVPPSNIIIRRGHWIAPFIGPNQYLLRIEENLGGISKIQRKTIIHPPRTGQSCVITAFGNHYLSRVVDVAGSTQPRTLAHGDTTITPFSLKYEEANRRPHDRPYSSGDSVLEWIQNTRCLLTIIECLPSPSGLGPHTTISTPLSVSCYDANINDSGILIQVVPPSPLPAPRCATPEARAETETPLGNYVLGNETPRWDEKKTMAAGQPLVSLIDLRFDFEGTGPIPAN